jgi:hypothetical protein
VRYRFHHARRRIVAFIFELLETFGIPFGIAVAFVVVAWMSLTSSRDPAALIAGLAALSISLFNLWRANWQQARITALLVDHPTVHVIGNALAVRYQLTQPLIVENTGGRPCVLAGVELDEPWFGAGNWFTEGVSLRDVVVPRALNPRDPVIARLVFDRSAYGTSPRGERYDLAEALEAFAS